MARATCGTDKARANTPGITTKATTRALSVGLSRNAQHGHKDRQVASSHDERLPGVVLA
ncbi:MAG: hypothetical protein KAV00_06500 [Phycisphaerae bacterium]|nr:hypothetical protein [Phycisphaerae bacterium]